MSDSRSAILAGVDGTPHSADAVALANVLAPALQADVAAVLVHPFGNTGPAPAYDHADEIVPDVRASVLEHMREYGTPIDVGRLKLVGDRSAARGLQHEAEQQDAVLIALGASRRSSLGRVLLGGTAERLTSGAPCPVAIAPGGYASEQHSIATIGCAFDGEAESRMALSWATEVATRTGSRIRLLAVHEPLASDSPIFRGIPMVAQDEAIRDQLSRDVKAAALELRRAGVDVDANLLTGRAAAELEDQSSAVDLLVTGSRGYGPSRAVLLGSVSTAVVRNAACPVAVVPRGAG